VGTNGSTAADGKKAAEVGGSYLGVSGKLRKLAAWSCNANSEQGNKPVWPVASAVLVARRHRSSKGDAMTTKPDLPIIAFASRNAWEAWLEKHHAASNGLWLEIAKKESGIETVSYAEALEAALCYGWIDGQKSFFDENYWLQRFTPRRPRSKWSKRNCQTATELIEKGKMKPAGLREVERAKADGWWDSAYDAQSTATVPEDFRRDLEKNEVAREFFATLDSRNRYAILYQIQDAKRPETRKRRIEKYVAMLSEQKKLYP
jgi:uncharacterized protein YdeI (YjbR/CyaY-like superfamily)